MIEEQDFLCRKILTEIKNIPVSKLFMDENIHLIPKTISNPVTLDLIESRLDKHVYSSSDEWVSDMRMLFMREYEGSPENSIRRAAAMHLSLEFEKLMDHFHPGMSPHIINLQIAEKEIRDISNSLVINSEIKRTKQSKPCSVIFDQTDEEITPKTIIHKISLLKNPELLLKVLAFIYKKQPECLLFGQVTSIEFCLLKEENLQALNEFIKKILMDAASGVSDPLNRIGSSDITPVDLKFL